MRVCLISRCRNQRNLKEWIAYHLTIGFSSIFIYDDFSEPSIESQLKSDYLSDVYVVRLEERVPIHPLKGGWSNGYRHIFEKMDELGLTYDYIIDLDTDEYLYLGGYLTIQEMLKDYEPFDILLLNWLLIGNKGMVTRPNDGILNTFDMCDNKFSTTGKSVAKLSSISKAKVSPHLFEYFSVHPSQLTIKNVLNQMVPNSIPIQNTEMASQMMYIIPIKKAQQKSASKDSMLELKQCLPCVFHYCVQDIETFLESKINNKRMRRIQIGNKGETELREVYPYSDKKLEFNIQKSGNNKKTGDKKTENKKKFNDRNIEKEFLDLLKSNQNEYKSVLEYYQNHNKNKIRNRLLFKKFRP